MRRLLAPGLSLFAAACALAPQEPKTPVTTGPVLAPPSNVLIGLTIEDLGQRLGRPDFQVREGDGTKLQWSANGCVLDAYLYPPENGHGAQRVTHVDARRPSGDDLDLSSCLSLVGR